MFFQVEFPKIPKSIKRIFKSFSKVISTLWDITCIGVVCFDIVGGIMKYVEKPQGTKISIDHSYNHKFPTMVFCFDLDEKRFNADHLKNCKIDG